eukprot:1165392-Pyramimonas_sp.AAC.2
MAPPAEWLDDIEQRAAKCKNMSNAPATVGHNPGTDYNIELTDAFKNTNGRTSNVSRVVDVATVDCAIPVGEIALAFRAGGGLRRR